MQAYLVGTWFPEFPKGRMGGRAFSYQAPLLWNQLPVQIQEADTLSTFKSRLKTFLFNKALVSYSYAAIGLDCWGTLPQMHWAPFLLLSLSPLLSPTIAHRFTFTFSHFLFFSLSTFYSPQLVKADGCPPCSWFCWRFLPLKGVFFSPMLPRACSRGNSCIFYISL